MFSYKPSEAISWQNTASAAYGTTCLTQCILASSLIFITSGTDGHMTSWAFPFLAEHPNKDVSRPSLGHRWIDRRRVHQNTIKALAVLRLSPDQDLLLTGGDEGCIGVLILSRNGTLLPPLTLPRAHTAAITACRVWFALDHHVYALTSGNDQKVKLWGLSVDAESDIHINWLSTVTTNVADVSSIAWIQATPCSGRALICGVGMEIVRIDWESSSRQHAE